MSETDIRCVRERDSRGWFWSGNGGGVRVGVVERSLVGCQAVGGPPEASGGWPLLGHIVPILRSPLGFLPGLAKYGAVVKIRFGTLPV